MVNFGPLAAEISSLVWGTPANFNGFRILAALLHGTLVVGISQTLRRSLGKRALPIFGRAAIMVMVTVGFEIKRLHGHYSNSFACLETNF